MAGVAAWGRVAPGVTAWRDFVPHVVMAAVMAFTMIGQPSAFKALLGAATLVVASVAIAPSARRSRARREQIADHWAMALVLLALLPHATALPVAHGHAGMPLGGTPAVVAITVGWLVTRAALMRARDAGRRGALVSALLTAVAIALMAALCG